MQIKSKLKKIYRPDWTKGIDRDKKKLWLDKNENSDEILLKQTSNFFKKVNKKVFSSYPNLAPTYKKLAKKLKLDPKNILLTAGSDLGIKAVFETFVREKDIVVRTNPTFAMYSVYSKIFRVREKKIEYKNTDIGPQILLEKVLSYLKNYKVKLFCLANPDSPTGHSFSLRDIKIILKFAKKRNTIVLIDEAYYPFYPYTCKNLLKSFENLIVVRTFSKAWGLAGVRVGYVLSSKKIISELHKTRPMYEINNLGTELLNIYLNNEKVVKNSVKRLMIGKEYFKKKLILYGFKLFKKEEGNFLHVDFKKNKNKIFAAINKKVYFRQLENHPSMKNFSRFSLTTKENFEKILKIIKKNNK